MWFICDTSTKRGIFAAYTYYFSIFFTTICSSVPSEQNCNLQYNSTGNKNVLIPRYIFVRLPGWRCIFLLPRLHSFCNLCSLYISYLFYLAAVKPHITICLFIKYSISVEFILFSEFGNKMFSKYSTYNPPILKEITPPFFERLRDWLYFASISNSSVGNFNRR